MYELAIFMGGVYGVGYGRAQLAQANAAKAAYEEQIRAQGQLLVAHRQQVRMRQVCCSQCGAPFVLVEDRCSYCLTIRAAPQPAMPMDGR